MNYSEIIVQLLLSVLFGGIIGLERERHGKPAGARTYALVTMGSALFTILSVHGFAGMTDPSRMAANIVVGIGFLGAGIILYQEKHIEGLTTAAGLWVAAALGIVIGVGWYLISIVVTLLILLVFLFEKYTTRLIKWKR